LLAVAVAAGVGVVVLVVVVGLVAPPLQAARARDAASASSGAAFGRSWFVSVAQAGEQPAQGAGEQVVRHRFGIEPALAHQPLKQGQHDHGRLAWRDARVRVEPLEGAGHNGLEG
jgi:hypothetical protein